MLQEKVGTSFPLLERKGRLIFFKQSNLEVGTCLELTNNFSFRKVTQYTGSFFYLGTMALSFVVKMVTVR